MRASFVVTSLSWLLSLAIVACGGGGSDDASDAGTHDATNGDTHFDAAPETIDDTAVETAPDTTNADVAPDAPVDTAPPTALLLAVPCSDTADVVYTTPTGLPPLDASKQGDIVRCTRDPSEDGPTVDANLKSKGITLASLSSATSVVRVAFRTQRADHRDALSTALVYLPAKPVSIPQPVVVATHASEGMADSCAPSKNESSLWDVALSWAARGYAVIAPDYAGLGNEGTQGYLDNRDQAYSVLDAARALRKLLLPGTFDHRVVVAGWSQGGGAALSAQSLAASYGVGDASDTLAAVVAFAPEWPIRANSFDLEHMLANPTEDIAFPSFSYSNHAIWAQRAYAFFSNFATTIDPGAGFPPDKRSAYVSILDSACGEVAIGGEIYAAGGIPPVTFAALFDPDLRVSLLACMQGGDTDPGCVGTGKELADRFASNVLTADAHGAPILYVQGLADTVLPPAGEAACIVDKLSTDGASVQVCVDAVAQHTDVTDRNIPFAIDWVEAQLAKRAPPDCPTIGVLPACSP
jgi:dienelactone hydrolase